MRLYKSLTRDLSFAKKFPLNDYFFLEFLQLCCCMGVLTVQINELEMLLSEQARCSQYYFGQSACGFFPKGGSFGCLLVQKFTKNLGFTMGGFVIQVVPGRAGGGSFRRKKWCIARKEFAYRMRARRPTSAMPKPFLCCERAFCCSMVLMCRGGDLTSFDVMRSVAG